MYTITSKTTDNQTITYKKDRAGVYTEVTGIKLLDYEDSITEHTMKLIIEELIRLGVTELKIEKEIPKYKFISKSDVILEFDVVSEVEATQVIFKPTNEYLVNDWSGVKRVVEIISNGEDVHVILHEVDEILRPLEESDIFKLKELGLSEDECVLLEQELEEIASTYIKTEKTMNVGYVFPVGESVISINKPKIGLILNDGDGSYLFDSSEQYSVMDTYISMNSKFACPLTRKIQTLSVSILSEKNTVYLDVSIFDNDLDDPWTDKEEITEGSFRFCPQLYLNVREPLNYVEWSNVMDEADVINKLEEITSKIFFNSRLIASAVSSKDVNKEEEEMASYLSEHKIILKNTKQ